MCPSFRGVEMWRENVPLRTDEMQLKILLSHRGLLQEVDELIWVKCLEQSLAQSKDYEVFTIMTFFFTLLSTP